MLHPAELMSQCDLTAISGKELIAFNKCQVICMYAEVFFRQMQLWHRFEYRDIMPFIDENVSKLYNLFEMELYEHDQKVNFRQLSLRGIITGGRDFMITQYPTGTYLSEPVPYRFITFDVWKDICEFEKKTGSRICLSLDFLSKKPDTGTNASMQPLNFERYNSLYQAAGPLPPRWATDPSPSSSERMRTEILNSLAQAPRSLAEDGDDDET